VELPWTKREIIDTVIAEYQPGSEEPFVSVMVRMFSRLALGRPEGRAPLTPDSQLSPSYRELAKILDESDRKARRGKRG
jgi:hypothetical protein